MTGESSAAKRRRTLTLPSGATVEVEQLSFKDFCQAREEALAEYKRGLISTYTRNSDLAPPEMKEGLILKAFEKCESITADDMPKRKAWLPQRQQNGKPVRNKGEAFKHEPSGEWIKTGDPLLEEQEIDFASWWLSYTSAGKIYGVWLALRRCQGQENITLDAVGAMFIDQLAALDAAADVVGEISTPQLGNL